jgi:ABC-type multidrug transport system fused ATPase/permease subunit
MSRFNSSGEQKGELSKARLNRENLKKLSFLFQFLAPYRSKFIAAMMLLGVGSSISLSFPWLLGQLIDLVSGNTENTHPWFTDLNRIISAIIGLLLLSSVMTFFRIMWFAEVGEKSLADIRSGLFSHLLKLPKQFFDQNSTGSLLSRINNDLSQIQDTLSTFLANLIRQIIILSVGITIVLINNTKLALLMLAVIPPVVAFALIFGRKIRKVSRETQDALATSNEIAEESLSGLINVKSYTKEADESKRFRSALKKVVHLAITNSKYRGAFAASVIFLMFSAILGVLWYGFLLIQQGEMSLGQLNTFIFYGLFIAGSMAGFAENYNQLLKTIGSTERIFEIMHTKQEKGGEINVHEGNGQLEIKELSFRYASRSDVEVLSQINLSIMAGQKLALVGESGAGKSTLAAMLLRLYDPVRGQISLDGVPLEQYDLYTLRALIAYVPQDVHLFSGTIRENIRYGKKEASNDEIMNAAERSYCMNFIEKLPDGMDTLVGEKGLQLSGGQRQRIAIARAFLKNPLVLILDEATSALDAESESQVQEAMKEIMKDRTSVIIAHRLSTIRFADNIAVMQNGKVIEQGTHDELIAKSNGAYNHLLKLQYHS